MDSQGTFSCGDDSDATVAPEDHEDSQKGGLWNYYPYSNSF